MKNKNRWILIALLAVAAVILLTALLRSPGSAEPKTEDGEKTVETGAAENEEESGSELDIPIDSTPADNGSGSAPSNGDAPDADPTPEPTPRIDPLTGLELEEDELPIIAP